MQSSLFIYFKSCLRCGNQSFCYWQIFSRWFYWCPIYLKEKKRQQWMSLQKWSVFYIESSNILPTISECCWNYNIFIHMTAKITLLWLVEKRKITRFFVIYTAVQLNKEAFVSLLGIFFSEPFNQEVPLLLRFEMFLVSFDFTWLSESLIFFSLKVYNKRKGEKLKFLWLVNYHKKAFPSVLITFDHTILVALYEAFRRN